MLKGQGFATSDLTAQFQHIQQLAGGERAVAWADQSSDTSVLDASSVAPSGGNEFDVRRLIEFPVLSCVGTTRKHYTQYHLLRKNYIKCVTVNAKEFVQYFLCMFNSFFA